MIHVMYKEKSSIELARVNLSFAFHHQLVLEHPTLHLTQGILWACGGLKAGPGLAASSRMDRVQIPQQLRPAE